MINRLRDLIKSRSKAEWRQYFKMQVDMLRRYIQENGERAAVVGFIVGIVIVIFIKLALILVVLGVIAYQSLLMLADEE